MPPGLESPHRHSPPRPIRRLHEQTWQLHGNPQRPPIPTRLPRPRPRPREPQLPQTRPPHPRPNCPSSLPHRQFPVLMNRQFAELSQSLPIRPKFRCRPNHVPSLQTRPARQSPIGGLWRICSHCRNAHRFPAGLVHGPSFSRTANGRVPNRSQSNVAAPPNAFARTLPSHLRPQTNLNHSR